jgi:hypothetical protein
MGKIRDWWEGEMVVNPHFTYQAGREWHWTAHVCRAVATFVGKNYQWLITVGIAIIGVYLAYVALQNTRSEIPKPTSGAPIVNQNVASHNQSGGITAHTVYVGAAKLRFDPAVAEELLRKIPSGKPVLLRGIGSTSDQAVVTEYQSFLESRGVKIDRAMIGTLSPPPDQKSLSWTKVRKSL